MHVLADSVVVLFFFFHCFPSVSNKTQMLNVFRFHINFEILKIGFSCTVHSIAVVVQMIVIHIHTISHAL